MCACSVAVTRALEALRPIRPVVLLGLLHPMHAHGVPVVAALMLPAVSLVVGLVLVANVVVLVLVVVLAVVPHGLAELEAQGVRDLAPAHAARAQIEDARLAGPAVERLAQLLARRVVDAAPLETLF